MLNYKATGQLIASFRIEPMSGETPRFVVMVRRGDQDYVVSNYVNGNKDWVSGRYFDNQENALKKFCEQCELYRFVD